MLLVDVDVVVGSVCLKGFHENLLFLIYNHLINDGLGSSLRIDLLTVSVVTNTRRWGSDTSALSGTNSDNLAVDGARNTVVDLDVELWKGVFLVDGSLGNVTNGGRLDHVSDGESLDGLVLLNSLASLIIASSFNQCVP